MLSEVCVGICECLVMTVLDVVSVFVGCGNGLGVKDPITGT